MRASLAGLALLLLAGPASAGAQAPSPDFDALARTIDTHIANLRKKLADHGACGYLVSVRSVGYRLAGEHKP